MAGYEPTLERFERIVNRRTEPFTLREVLTELNTFPNGKMRRRGTMSVDEAAKYGRKNKIIVKVGQKGNAALWMPGRAVA